MKPSAPPGARAALLGLALLALGVGALVWTLRPAAPRTEALDAGSEVEVAQGPPPLATNPEELAPERESATPASTWERAVAESKRSAAEAAPERAHLEGFVLDGQGSGLAHCVVTILRRDGSEELGKGRYSFVEHLDTDRDGRFRTSSALPPGRYSVQATFADCSRPKPPTPWDLAEMTDREAQMPLLLVDHLPPSPVQRLRLRLDPGPSYEIETAIPPGYEPCDFAGELLGVEKSCRSRSGSERRAPLAGVGPFRLRFEALGRNCQGPWTLALESSDGWWAGRAPVQTIEGRCEAPVAIELRPRARLSGRVTDERGRGLAGIELRFDAGDGSSSTASSRHAGEYAFESLPAGPGVLRASPRVHEAFERELDLAPLSETALDLRLTEVPHGDVTGFLRARSGALSPAPRIRLRRADAPGSAGERGRVFGVDERSARFVFEDVPAGVYELVLEPLDSHRWIPERLTVRAPASGIELVRLDDELPMLLLDVLDARDGSRVPSARCFVGGEGGTRCVDGAHGTIVVDRVTADCGPTVLVTADGFRPVELGIAALRRDGRFRLGTAVLQPGWGAVARAVEAGSGAPLAGATILCDGERSGVTGADGRVVLSAERQPERVEAALDGYRFREEPGAATGGELVLKLVARGSEGAK